MRVKSLQEKQQTVETPLQIFIQIFSQVFIHVFIWAVQIFTRFGVAEAESVND